MNVPCVIVAATRTRWPQARMFLALHGQICCRWRPAVFPLTPSLHHSLTCSRAFLCTIPLGPAEFFGELYCPEPGAVREGDGAVLPDANALIPSKVRGRVGLQCLAYQSRRATLTPNSSTHAHFRVPSPRRPTIPQCLTQAFRSLKGVDRLRVFFVEQAGNHLLVLSMAGKHGEWWAQAWAWA